MSALTIRRAEPGDAEAVCSLLRDLAEYEKLLDKFNITTAIVERDYLSANPLCHAELALEGAAPVGVMTWYWTYASFAAGRGIFLEDLFVRPEYRGKGYGKRLLSHLAKRAIDAHAVRIDWTVLDWNKPSIDFYELIGARRHEGWYTYRLSDEALRRLATG